MCILSGTPWLDSFSRKRDKVINAARPIFRIQRRAGNSIYHIPLKEFLLEKFRLILKVTNTILGYADPNRQRRCAATHGAAIYFNYPDREGMILDRITFAAVLTKVMPS
jgi:hypothetical protein